MVWHGAHLHRPNMRAVPTVIQMFSTSVKHFNNALNLLTALGKLGMVI